MAQRLEKLNERRTATRHLLGWFGVSAASLVLAAFTVTCSAQSDTTGLMLRPGIETGLDTASLPADGWYRVTNKDRVLQVQAVAAPVSVPGEEEAEAIDTRYIRVPGARIAEGRLPAVAFPGGLLTPQVDHAYQLALGGTPFTLTVGDGAVYTVQIGEDSYSFHVDGDMDGESRILAAADIDSDGKPDFIVQVGDQEVLLLSSRTQPGLNPPAAVLALSADGC
jgi:hypothetical protein